jgi:hypothetical protein
MSVHDAIIAYPPEDGVVTSTPPGKARRNRKVCAGVRRAMPGEGGAPEA